MQFISKNHKLVYILLYFLISSAGAKAVCPNLTLNFTTPAQSNCGVPASITFDNTTTGSGANNTTWYYWKINGVLVDSTLNSVPHFTYAFPAPGTYTVRMVAKTPGNCRDSITKNITITSGTPQVYNGAAVLTYTPTWNNCILNPLQSNNYNVSISSNAVLNNYTIIWGDATANNTGASLAIGNSVNHTYTNLGQYTVKIITQNGACFDTISGTVFNMRPVSTSIKPLPAGQLAGCAPHTITFQDSTQNPLPGTILTWDFGDGTIIRRDYTQANQPISHTYLPVGTGNCVYTVSLRAFNPNCNTGPNNASTYTISPILIFDKDVARINPPTNLCQPSLTYTFGNGSDDNCITGTRYYYWDFGDGTNTGWITSKGAQTHTFPTIGSYTIMLIDSNGCGSDTAYATVVVNTPPNVGFTLTPKTGCAPLVVSLTDTSTGIGNARAWSLVGGSPSSSTLASLNTTYNTAGTYIVRLTINNPCATNVIKTDTVRVYSKPLVQIGNAVSGCVPHSIQLQNNTTRQGPTATYFWDFGNGQTSTLRNPPVANYNLTGNYTIKLVVTDSCGKDSQLVSIAVSTLPTASFTTTTVCKGQSTQFTSTSTVAVGDVITNYKWIYGNGDSTNSGTSPQNYTYANSGSFNAILQITTDKNCVDRDTVAVQIKASPSISFTNTPTNICDGTVVSFDGTVTTNAPSTITSYKWSFGTSDTARIEDTVYRFPSTGNYNVIYTATNDVGCVSSTNKTITIYPNPDARLFRNISCSNQLTQFKDSSIVIGAGNTITHWAWDFNNDGVIDSTTQHPKFKFTTPGLFKTKLTVTTNHGCSNTDSLNTTANVSPIAAAAPVSNPLCKNDTFTFTNTSFGAFAYGWDMGDGTGEYFETTTAPFQYIFPDSGQYTIKLTAYSLQGCRDSIYTTITARPLPVANFIVNDTLGCAPKQFTFTNTSTIANGYKWLVGNAQTTTVTNRPDTIVSQSGQAVVIKLIATNQYNCKPDTAIKTLYTFSNPTPNFTLSLDSGCAPMNVSFTNTTPNGVSYVWRLGNGQTTTSTHAATSYLASLNSDTIYSIKLIASNGPGCADSITKTVRVFPKPLSVFNPIANTGCGPLSTSFTNTSTHNYGGNQSNMSFNWNFGNSTTSTQTTPLATFIANATKDTIYTVRLIAFSRFGCADTSTKTVRVYPNPRSQFTVLNPAGCGPLSTGFNNISIPNDTGSIGIMSFNWRLGNGQTSTQLQPTAQYIASKTMDSIYTIRLIAFSEHGCRDTSYQNVRVYPNPTASFSRSITNGCAPLGVNFTNTSVPNDTGSINIMTFNWTLGNGFVSNSQSTSSTYYANLLTDTTYTVKLQAISEHGCVDTTSRTVVVHPKPITAFAPNKTSGCGPLTVQFTSSSQLAAQYFWNFSDGDTSMKVSPTHTFASYDIYDSIYPVRLSTVSAFGCLGDTMTTNIVTRYNPVADFFPLQDSICGSGNVAFFNASLGGIQNAWSFKNGQTSTSINPVSSFIAQPTKDTIYNVRLIVTSPYGCKDTAIKPVKLNPIPDAQFANVVASCTPHRVTFTNSSLRGVSYLWEFGDATTDTSTQPTKIFTNNVALVNRTYPVTLTATSASGCIDTAKRNVVVYPLPIPNVSANKSQQCDTTAYNFFNTTIGANNYLWHFGDGFTSTLPVPTHHYRTLPNRDTTYQVKLIATTTFGCKDSASTTAIAHPLVIANFASNTTQSCQNLNVTFQNQSINAINYFWFFGDGAGSTSSTPTHAYNNIGSYGVKLIAYDQFGCTDTIEKPGYINIYEVPDALFTYNPIKPQLPNTTVNFTDRSYLSSGVLSYHWNFGDVASTSNESLLQHPSHTFSDSGTFVVKQTITTNFGCVDSLSSTVYVHPRKPIPDFEYTPKDGCKPLLVQFTNKTTYADSYEWDFGDGNTSTQENPTHTYTRDDTYTVRLKAFGPGGDSTVVKMQIITVHDLPRARFGLAPETVYLPDAHCSFTNTSFDAAKSFWYVIDDNNDVVFTDTNYHSGFDFTESGIYSVKLVVKNQYECTDTFYLQNSVTVDLHGVINIPTAFSPNGDGKNETYKPVVSGVQRKGYVFKIYDRWGKCVFETTDPYAEWDGGSSGTACASDVYVWFVEGFFSTGEKFSKRGQLTLLR